MHDSQKGNASWRAGASGTQATGRGLQPNYNADPYELVLSRAENVKRLGDRKAIFSSPNRPDRTPSVSITVGDDGRVLMHDFGGDSAAQVMQGLGLTLADLFPVRLAPQTDTERRAARRAMQESGWRAALPVLDREATVVLIAARMVLAGTVLPDDDHARLAAACERIESAREVLR